MDDMLEVAGSCFNEDNQSDHVQASFGKSPDNFSRVDVFLASLNCLQMWR